jgi:hypothetical protein
VGEVKLIQTTKPKLHVIAVVSNPIRFSSRYNLFKKFQAEMALQKRVVLHVCEVAFGARKFEIAESGHAHHLRLRTLDEIWHKENMINLSVQRLPSNWKYMAWVDADISFVNPNWVAETIEQLQHFNVVQMWQDAHDLGPSGETIQTHRSFAYQYSIRAPRKPGYTFWHPGFAWAINREAYNAVGGLLDTAVLGAGDHHMALGMIGEAETSLPGGISPGYKSMVMNWQENAKTGIRRDLGFVPGSIVHHWHGKKKDRRYVERWEILTRNKFCPLADLKRDWQGLYQLSDRNIKLRDDIRDYFRARNEDSIDLV